MEVASLIAILSYGYFIAVLIEVKLVTKQLGNSIYMYGRQQRYKRRFMILLMIFYMTSSNMHGNMLTCIYLHSNQSEDEDE